MKMWFAILSAVVILSAKDAVLLNPYGLTFSAWDLWVVRNECYKLGISEIDTIEIGSSRIGKGELSINHISIVEVQRNLTPNSQIRRIVRFTFESSFRIMSLPFEGMLVDYANNPLGRAILIRDYRSNSEVLHRHSNAQWYEITINGHRCSVDGRISWIEGISLAGSLLSGCFTIQSDSIRSLSPYQISHSLVSGTNFRAILDNGDWAYCSYNQNGLVVDIDSTRRIQHGNQY